MSTKININDHGALNAAFAEKVAGWVKYDFDNATVWLTGKAYAGMLECVEELRFTRSMDAVLPYLGPDLVGISVPKFKGDTWSVHVAPDAAQVEYRAEAPTLPHAAVVALLRVKGVTVEGDKT